MMLCSERDRSMGHIYAREELFEKSFSLKLACEIVAPSSKTFG